MKFSILAGAALLASADAFPNMMNHLRANGVPKLEKKKAAFEHPSVPGFSDLQIRQAVAFDAASQLVDVTGDHAFVAPGPTDQRGPCPGLNAMANHGYLPHDGIATLDQFIEGTGKVFGMGVDLSTFLAIYGAVFDGDGATTWSIGGPDSRVTPLLGLLGTPEGISGSHNKYEGDASPTRGDLYQKGNDYLLQMDQFQALYDLGKADDNYDLQLLTDYRYTRFHESISQNPYFFNAPFSGVVAQPAAWAFIYRFMSNKSAEYPEGRLNGENLKSFYAITGDDGDFTYTPGNERIPDNWYTRNALDQYTIPFLSLDSNTMLLQHLEFGSVGGNTGTPNSFVGVDPGDLTSGVFNADTLTQGNNLMCYGLELSIQETPDILAGIFTDDTNPLNKALSALGDASNSLGCPKLTQINKDQFSNYPGYTASYSGYSPPTSGGIL